mmetsp:Transcript_67083/g.106670  ORF Transcript_67083/g.106670 Transcript_67083/m.106670 type:complete len:132 (-) Transcript_67083:74-469(-)
MHWNQGYQRGKSPEDKQCRNCVFYAIGAVACVLALIIDGMTSFQHKVSWIVFAITVVVWGLFYYSNKYDEEDVTDEQAQAGGQDANADNGRMHVFEEDAPPSCKAKVMRYVSYALVLATFAIDGYAAYKLL